MIKLGAIGNMSNEIIETAKATQEIAKATVKGLETTEKLGGFLSKVFGEPLETAVGMLGDKLKFMRLERQLRLIDQVDKINRERGIFGQEIPVPPKIAIPIIENASLEESDQLQNLWAYLLSTAQDKSKQDITNHSYIEILKQINFDEAEILKSMLNFILKEYAKDPTKNRQTLTFRQIMLMADCGINQVQGQDLIADNLKRLGLIRKTGTDMAGHDVIQLTNLGMEFIKACTN